MPPEECNWKDPRTPCPVHGTKGKAGLDRPSTTDEALLAVADAIDAVGTALSQISGALQAIREAQQLERKRSA